MDQYLFKILSYHINSVSYFIKWRIKMKKTLSFTLIAILTQIFFVQLTFAKTKEEKFVETVRTKITKLGTGSDAKIKLKLKDGTKLKGYIIESNEDGFAVMNSKTGQPVSVSYSQVGQAKGNNLSSGVIIVIGVVAAIVFIIFAASQLK